MLPSVNTTCRRGIAGAAINARLAAAARRRACRDRRSPPIGAVHPRPADARLALAVASSACAAATTWCRMRLHVGRGGQRVPDLRDGIEHRLVAMAAPERVVIASPAAASAVTTSADDRGLTAHGATRRAEADRQHRAKARAPCARGWRPSATTASPTSATESSATALHAFTTCSMVIPVSPSPRRRSAASANRESARRWRPCGPSRPRDPASSARP